MRVDSLYIVTNPTRYSTIHDILCACDYQGLQYQFLGGLKAHEIFGIYTDRNEAEKIANDLLKVLKG